MEDKVELRLFELAKNVDAIQHNISAELSVKTSLYLVFSAFVFSASLQLMSFAKDLHSYVAVFLCGIGAVVSLLSAIALLVGATVRNYKIFPAQDMTTWIKEVEEYRRTHPGEETSDPFAVIRETLVETADLNQEVNERKAGWVETGAWLLFGSMPFLAIGGGLAVWILLSHPF